MMDRGVMQRQMFAKGGAAFPDLSGDGRVTQKDILMGRGVPMQQGGNPQMALNDYLGDQTSALAAEAARLGISEEQLLALLNQQAQPEPPVGMAMGGDPAMAQGVASMMPTEMAAAPGMAGAMAAQSDMPSEAVSQAAGAMDPAVLEQMLGTVDENIQNLDGAEDFETVMNSMRGDDASIEERYAELADVVGQEDAAQTPESVLALVQPVMMLNAVDQGIGGLAQEEMTAPVEGAMAEGIMSTVAPPPQEAAPMPPAGMGGPPPVNFKDGGLVRRGDNQPVQMFDNGGGVTNFFGPRVNISPAQSQLLRQQVDMQNLQQDLAEAQALPTARPLEEIFKEKKGVYSSLLGDSASREDDLEKQRDMTKAQMLFDIANTALAFAAPMEGERAGMSPAERLAMAARSTQLPQTIGARAQAQLEAERATKKEERALDLAALQAAETTQASEAASAASYRQKKMELDAKTTTLGVGEKLFDSNGVLIAEGEGQTFTLAPGQVRTNAKGEVLASGNNQSWTLSEGQVVVDAKGNELAAGAGKTYMLSPGTIVKDAEGKTIAKGTEPAVKGIPRDIFNKLPEKSRNIIMLGNPSVNGVPASIFAQLNRDDQNVILSLTQNNVKGIPKPIYDGLSDDDKRKVLLGAQSEERMIKGIPESVYNKLPDALRTQILGGMITLAEGHKVINVSDGKTVAEGADKTITLSPGQIVVDRNNNTLAEGPAKELVADDVKYLSDEKRIDAYANNTLGEETTEFEQAILDYVSKPTRVWNGSGYVAGDAPQLSPRLKQAILARSAAGLPELNIPGFVATPTVSRITPGDGATDAELGTGAGTVIIPDDITSSEFNAMLFAADGSINLNSPAWDSVPTNIIDPDMNYPGSTGLASGYPRLKNYFAETFRELGGSGLTEEGKELSRADSDLISLRNELLTVATQGGMAGDQDRILKMVQEQLMEETNKLTPGMFTTDETALSKLMSVEEKLASNFQVLSARVPEYGGNPNQFSEEQVLKARAKLGSLKNVIAEVRTLRKIYENALSEGALGLTPEKRKSAKEWLLGNRG